MLLTAAESTFAIFWPKRGACSTTAVSMSGSFRSCVKRAVPLDFAFESVRRVSLPM
jgi:hypothetical protein